MQKIGKYELIEQIGVGGFGEVYKGFDPFIKRHVAIKTCSSNSDEIRTRFFQEAEIAGNLSHRNITTVYDFGVQNELPYLIQEYLSGEDLDSKIKRRDYLPFAEKLFYLLQIARGLAHAHAHGVIHRDIKPANIRILEDGTTKIMDFGIAKLAQQESGLTQTGMTLGTAAYLAPEQIRGEPVDHRTDIFSFGVLAYELLTFRRPFQGQQISAVLYQLLHSQPKPITDSWPTAPPEVVELIDRCLAKDPTSRFLDGSELLRELETLQKQGRADRGGSDDGQQKTPTAIPTYPAIAQAHPAVAQAHPAVAQAHPAVAQAHPAVAQAHPAVAQAQSQGGKEPASPPTTLLDPLPAAPTQSGGLGDLELSAEPTDLRSGVSPLPEPTKAARPNRHSAVWAIVALVLVALVSGWWFGTRGRGDDATGNAATVQTTDVGGESGDSDQGAGEAVDVPEEGTAGAEAAPSGITTSNEPEKPVEVKGTLAIVAPSWTKDMTVRFGNSAQDHHLQRNRFFPVSPGNYQLTFTIDISGYQRQEAVQVRVDEGVQRKVRSPIEQPGALSVRPKLGTAQGTIWLDGTMVAPSPLRRTRYAPGTYSLEIRPLSDGEQLSQQLTITAGNETILTFDLSAAELQSTQRPLQ